MPPPYSERNSTEESVIVIKSSDVPQWHWSKFHCRQWLAACLEDYLNYHPDAAQRKAAEFEGYGPNIFITSQWEWKELLGTMGGRSIYCMIVGLRNRPGAVPKGLEITHGSFR